MQTHFQNLNQWHSSYKIQDVIWKDNAFPTEICCFAILYCSFSSRDDDARLFWFLNDKLLMSWLSIYLVTLFFYTRISFHIWNTHMIYEWAYHKWWHKWFSWLTSWKLQVKSIQITNLNGQLYDKMCIFSCWHHLFASSKSSKNQNQYNQVNLFHYFTDKFLMSQCD